MSLFVKICGMTDEASAEAAVQAGAQAVGFVFAMSPRQVSITRAREITEVIPPGVARVAVFRRPTPSQVIEVVREFQPDLVQADFETLAGLEGIEALPVYRDGSEDVPDGGRFLFEGPISGVGHQVDLTRAATMARRGEMILAGGLNEENVGRVVAEVMPFGVDVSSGVETTPGVKSPEMIRSFVAAVRTAEERLVTR
ncbi:MAG: phosphoribosylanthranilate isomerase [Acidimicrobiia bacterium]